MTDEPLRVRAPVVRIVDHGDSTTVIGPAATRRFDGDSAALLRAVLELHTRPIGRTQLFGALSARAGVAPDQLPGRPPGQSIDDLVALLVADGILVPARELPAGRPATGRRRVVLGISGAISAIDAPAVIRGLHAAG
ncbi:MAG TPA: hypothetical protein VFT22_11965, partial [Kofleriaceae bacterium]|nr:hypothetical protein [Kofleriaceae bacterium]